MRTALYNFLVKYLGPKQPYFPFEAVYINCPANPCAMCRKLSNNYCQEIGGKLICDECMRIAQL